MSDLMRSSRSLELLPAPFAWIEIPSGDGSLTTSDPAITLPIPTARYWIARYPVTNAQFARFLDAGGYHTPRWWTEAGWSQRQTSAWTQPRLWTDPQWNGADQPVVGVSWFEAVAFCHWLKDMTGEPITLPTEAQWQYAAQGDDGRLYPWGNDWDWRRCNNSVAPCSSSATTPVRAYEGTGAVGGDSPFGVVDMTGNVWEWCLTDFHTHTNDIHYLSARRVLRGGWWSNRDQDAFRCDCRAWSSPDDWSSSGGFRLARSV